MFARNIRLSWEAAALYFAISKKRAKGVAHLGLKIGGYFRLWRIRIRGRFGTEPMQLFTRSKNMFLAKNMIRILNHLEMDDDNKNSL